jgi:S-adenosylmethionine:tRNA ribosyltransferase-isomerase
VVDAVLTGVHESDTTHFTLLKAFADRKTLDGALARAIGEDLLGHEFGDAWLVWGERLERRVSSQQAEQREQTGRCAPAPCVSGATVAA